MAVARKAKEDGLCPHLGGFLVLELDAGDDSHEIEVFARGCTHGATQILHILEDAACKVTS